MKINFLDEEPNNCPKCFSELEHENNYFRCWNCSTRYFIDNELKDYELKYGCQEN